MKKNISINISGIIFHIEEDGYEALKKYLDSINKYFSSYDDSSEILADIESRIAEIFLSRLSEGKQVITQEDVQSLIATMGSVSDFKAAEEQESQSEQTGTRSDYRRQEQKSYVPPQNKQFMRDQKRKILGGVCAGLANYFNVDPVWIRLLFALLTLAYGIILIVYVVLWIAVPGSYDLEELEISKKLFRNPEKKVLGGVAGGLSAYFGIDVVVVRVLFIIFTFFGGVGFFTYVLLWIVLPEAKSITDKMQMQGEPVTLSNIETNIKKNLDVKEGEEESILVKILLFPFRAIGWLITNLAKILGPVAEVFRVAIGIFITVIGLSLVVAVVAVGGILLGFITSSTGWVGMDGLSFPIDAMQRVVPGFTFFMAFIGCIIPGLIIVLLGVSVIAKRIIFNAATGWALFILFFLSVAVLSVSIPRIALGFKEEGESKNELRYSTTGKTLVLKIRETGMDDYDAATLKLEGYEGNEVKLVQVFEARGNTRMKAIENAQMVSYTVSQQDSVFTFDSNIRFHDDAIFRSQKVRMTLFIPYQKSFIMDDDFWRLLNTYIEPENRNGRTWRITDTRQLECLDCPVREAEDTEFWDEAEELSEDATAGTLSDFKEVEITGMFDLKIQQGNRYAVELTGPSSEREKYRINRLGNSLVIAYDDDTKLNWNNNPLRIDEVRIQITMPELDKLELSGAGKAALNGFTEDDMRIKILGAIKARGNINAREMSVYLSGASELELRGEGNNLDAKVLGASKLNAYDYRAKNALVEANGASKASVYVTGRLEINEGLASKVSYKGNPTEVFKD